MSIGISTQLLILALVVAIAAISLLLIRRRFANRSLVLGGAIAVSTAILLGQVASWYVAAWPTPNAPLALLAGFIGVWSVQPRLWSVTGLCRSLSMVSILVTVWAVLGERYVETSLSLLVTVLLLYVSLLAAREETSTDSASGPQPLGNT
jgi:hypothetical protein